MFCNQCEQTNKGKGCEKIGICGKKAEVADIQDALVAQLRELAHIALQARAKGIMDVAVDDFAAKALFSTLTNVNFDPEALRALQAATLLHAQELAKKAGCTVPADVDAMLAGHVTAITAFAADEDVRSAMQLLLYGLKGVAAYADHAAELGQRDPEVAAFLYRGLVAGSKNDTEARDLGGWLGLALECGKINLRAMELLETGNIASFGSPSPTKVSLGHRKGKAILISGHDLRDLELCYAPPFSSAKDAGNYAGLAACNLLQKTFRQVRTDQVRSLVEEIPKDRPVYLNCKTGQTSYNAVLALQGKGFRNVYNISGGFLGLCFYEYFNDRTKNREPIVTAYSFE